MALHESISVEKDRKTLLHSIDELRKDREENLIITEDYFRSAEKIDTLSERLTDARCLLDEMKQDNANVTEFSNSMMDTIHSLSPSRKQTAYPFSSPKLKSTLR